MWRFAVVLACVAASGGAWGKDSAEQTAAAVGAADREFARRAGEIGAAAAARDYMDPEEGLMFTGRGKPARGAAEVYAAMGGAGPDLTTLKWVPLSAWGSSGGDMGVTTGDWALFKKGAGTAMVTGRYVTVWRKKEGGAWKCLIDIGEPDAKPESNEATR
jgi:ketosteroid isomerase-like protein